MHDFFEIQLSEGNTFLELSLRLKYLPFKIIKFKLNLVDKWFDNIQMDTQFSKSKYLEDISLEKKINDDIITAYNKFISTFSIKKFNNMIK